MANTERVWRHVPRMMFRFTTTERAELRIAVLQAVHAASVTEPAVTFTPTTDPRERRRAERGNAHQR